MARAWMALMLVVGLAAMAHVAHRRLSYEEIVAKALRIFNQGRRGRSLFSLVEAIPPADSNSTAKMKFNFRIKETVCISARRREPQPQDCAFKEDGEERNCTGVFAVRRGRILRVNCRPGPLRQPEISREERSAEPAEAAYAEPDTSKLPPAVRDKYESAKYEIITDILRNF
ncbi:15 kDa protein B [Rousettus aegyptiacus]|uniref:Cathelicidin antimicrobial peptide n=1 Tax=Rousettus aegyptiacus TaxID=9407 RepID=A0A7J8HSR3_ROUAE|nr:15 kDa protein B [Rousettus aegyptiacus]KAF6475414.1 hypothetical protein HJG63_014142 [Rousettus aegyptiacus]